MIQKRVAINVVSCIILLYSFVFSQIPIILTGSLPASVDNSTNDYFRPIVSQRGETCGNVSGISYVFTYEINCARNLSSKTIETNGYPYSYTYHFLNDGYDIDAPADLVSSFFRMFLGAWKIVQENGIPVIRDFGGETSGFYTKWADGYDIYYRGMHNRVDKIDSLNMLETGSLAKMKQWLYDHGNGSPIGGIFEITFNVYGVQTATIATGPETGKTIIKRCGNDMSSAHGFGLVGYNDSIRFDFNADGRITNNIDITGDGKVTQDDWEIGAVKIAHTWGTSTWTAGFAYLPYRYLTMNAQNGGIQSNNRIYFITVKKTYTPRLTLKCSITHQQRNQIALSVGVSPDQNATIPTKVRRFEKQFTYAGGANPMGGKGMAATIQIGLDISDLIDSIGGASKGTYFLVVDSKGGNGTVNTVSIMDYTGGGNARETSAPQTNVAIASGKTYIGVSTTLTGIRAAAPGNAARTNAAVRFSSRGIQVRIPQAASGTVRLADLAGRVYIIRASGPAAAWVDLPNTLHAGIYILDVPGERGMRVEIPPAARQR